MPVLLLFIFFALMFLKLLIHLIHNLTFVDLSGNQQLPNLDQIDSRIQLLLTNWLPISISEGWCPPKAEMYS